MQSFPGKPLVMFCITQSFFTVHQTQYTLYTVKTNIWMFSFFEIIDLMVLIIINVLRFCGSQLYKKTRPFSKTFPINSKICWKHIVEFYFARVFAFYVQSRMLTMKLEITQMCAIKHASEQTTARLTSEYRIYGMNEYMAVRNLWANGALQRSSAHRAQIHSCMDRNTHAHTHKTLWKLSMYFQEVWRSFSPVFSPHHLFFLVSFFFLFVWAALLDDTAVAWPVVFRWSKSLFLVGNSYWQVTQRRLTSFYKM